MAPRLVARGTVRWTLLLLLSTDVLAANARAAQGLGGTLVATVKDGQGLAMAGARVRLQSAALLVEPPIAISDARGHARFPTLPPGLYVLTTEFAGFETSVNSAVAIGVHATTDVDVVLIPANVAESVVVLAREPRLEARNPGFVTRFGRDEIVSRPTSRSGVFDLIRTAPGISPTSPTSGIITTVSAFGSSTNENTLLIDGTDFTSPSNGAARAEPGLDFSQEVRLQSAGASAEYGGVQGVVIDVVTRQGSSRFHYDAAFYAQPRALTSQPVRLGVPGTQQPDSGYERQVYREITTDAGGPAIQRRLFFFVGGQYKLDEDSQPGTDPAFPRASRQHRLAGKLTWRPADGWRLVQGLHHERWVSPEAPTISRPFDSTLRLSGDVSALTLAHLSHTPSSNSVWDMRVGRFGFSQADDPASGSLSRPSVYDQSARRYEGAPPQVGTLNGARLTAKATLSHYQPAVLGASHEIKTGVNVEQGEHRSLRAIPSGVRFIVDSGGFPLQSISSDPSNAGGRTWASGVFITDALTVGSRITVTAGLRFDQSHASSQDLPVLDSLGRDTDAVVPGLGALYTWNMWSPRVGMTATLSAEGRTLLRVSAGRYHSGVLTGELSPFHPGVTAVTTRDFVAADGDYTRTRQVVDRSNLRLDRGMRAPYTDQYMVALEHELRRPLSMSLAVVHKEGASFIGWTDVAGRYREDVRTLLDGTAVPVFVLDADSPSRLFALTNAPGYTLRYDGLVIGVDKRRSGGWQASGSYTLSRATGLQPSSGTSAGGAQVSTVGSPPVFFGRDPNDLTNADGRLANDRPHMLRGVTSTDIGATGLTATASLQHLSGKPWGATVLMALPPPQSRQQRVQVEKRGSRRLPSQTLLDLRLSRGWRFGGRTRIELAFDLLNALNDAAAEGLVTDDLNGRDDHGEANFGQPAVFIDPRRALLSVRLAWAQ